MQGLARIFKSAAKSKKGTKREIEPGQTNNAKGQSFSRDHPNAICPENLGDLPDIERKQSQNDGPKNTNGYPDLKFLFFKKCVENKYE